VTGTVLFGNGTQASSSVNRDRDSVTVSDAELDNRASYDASGPGPARRGRPEARRPCGTVTPPGRLARAAEPELLAGSVVPHPLGCLSQSRVWPLGLPGRVGPQNPGRIRV
jgi:hypothetical protein